MHSGILFKGGYANTIRHTKVALLRGQQHWIFPQVTHYTLTKYIFGCGHDNRIADFDGESGVTRLGGGPMSFISRMSQLASGNFSH